MSIPDYTITELNLSNKRLTKLPNDIYKYTNLRKIDCSYNQLTSLDNLPYNLQLLDCRHNQLTSLDNLPPNLQELYCYYNPLQYNFIHTLENIRNYNKSKN
jgi:Leucine-rich repeat (LRR) protein